MSRMNVMLALYVHVHRIMVGRGGGGGGGEGFQHTGTTAGLRAMIAVLISIIVSRNCRDSSL